MWIPVPDDADPDLTFRIDDPDPYQTNTVAVPGRYLLFKISTGNMFKKSFVIEFNSVVDPDPYWIRIQSFLDPYSEYGSGSTQANIG